VTFEKILCKMSLIEIKYLVRKEIGLVRIYLQLKMHKIRIRCATSCAKD